MSNEFRDKLLTVGVLTSGRTRNRVHEYRDPDDGHRIKAVTDELNNTVTEHDTPDDRVDVMIRPETVRTHIGVNK